MVSRHSAYVYPALGPFHTGASVERNLLAQRGIAPLIPTKQAADRSVSSHCRANMDSEPLYSIGKLEGNGPPVLLISDLPGGWKIGPLSAWILQTGSDSGRCQWTCRGWHLLLHRGDGSAWKSDRRTWSDRPCERAPSLHCRREMHVCTSELKTRDAFFKCAFCFLWVTVKKIAGSVFN